MRRARSSFRWEKTVTDSYQIYPVGFIRKKGQSVRIEIKKGFEEALLGLDQFSHIYVLYWFDKNDTPEKRSTLQVHPRGDKKNPLTGVFATHSPNRPNLIALVVCKILTIHGNLIQIDRIDAFDGTPVIDIKSFNPKIHETTDCRVPTWASRRVNSC